MKRKNDSNPKQHNKEDLGFLDDRMQLLDTVRQMIDIEFERRGLNTEGNPHPENPPLENVWYAQPKSVQKLTNKMVVDRIVRETSLSAGNASNALISLGAIVRDALLMGASVELVVGNPKHRKQQGGGSGSQNGDGGGGDDGGL